MIYRTFKDRKISLLGMGCMRLPCRNGSDTEIDEKETEEMVDAAFRNGVNYFDSAWPYHGGNSETVIGKILQTYPRDAFCYASKFPGFNSENFAKYREIFEKQLEKCGLGYFDFYLLHNVCEADIREYLEHAQVLIPFLKEQKEKGLIRHIGFSIHGKPDIITRFLAAYKDIVEFCQIQLNWFDWDFLGAKKNVELLTNLGIPIWVMEPMRGGRLAGLPKDTEDKVEALIPGAKPAEVAFRYLQSFPNVVTILTGASTLDQMKENLAVFEKEQPLTEAETEGLYRIQKEMPVGAPCTYCRYCLDSCPQNLKIPKILAIYNDDQFTGNEFTTFLSVRGLPEGKRPMDCIQCRSCEEACPQGIKISEILKAFTERLETSSNPRNPFRKTN